YLLNSRKFVLQMAKKIVWIIFFLMIGTLLIYSDQKFNSEETVTADKLYWFIPDGMRADPDLFNIFEWAEQGKLPNIKKMMDKGAYGFTIPVFPSHTPVNFATLLTGTYPKTHGVADGPMHIEGRPLDKVAIGGFSSVAKKVPSIWTTLEEQGKKVLILSTPGSTPPEIDQGIVVRGRWGGWGADFHAINFESKLDMEQRKKQGRGSRLFFFGPQLTQYLDSPSAEGWENLPESFSEALEAEMASWGSTIYAYIYDSTDDSKINYDRIAFSKDKKEILADIGQGEWSEWQEVTLKWQEKDVKSNVIFHTILLEDDGFFRVRFFYNNLNEYITQPSTVAEELTTNVGPMVDFVDNFPPQLIYYDEDKQTFLDEMKQSFDWHTNVIPYIMNQYQPEVVVHDIYSPNQMLTSRWWLGYIDPTSQRYNDVTEEEREQLWQEVEDMYRQLDNMIGEMLENTDENTIVVLSSDHGAAPLNKWVRVNNLLAKNGLLKFTINEETGEPIIDWENSKAIYLKMDNVYVHPSGLAGDWIRGSGEEYEELRNQVIDILLNLEDGDGTKPVASVTKWEDVEEFLDLPTDRVGDLIIANKLGYGWNEEMTEDLELFSTPLKTGYKQAIHAEEENSMWTPFIIMGPGVKKGYKIEQPGKMVDQYPTIMTLLDMEIPDFVEGKVIEEIFEG
ncbi:MAG: alkaline phosphatase family protein, partial [Nanoarchaeota archaeon]|nr:alkaline phosphatase family protein [Nanoarchaeota archaeon]